MGKVFFDIGTNAFAGFDKLASMLEVDDSWKKVFVEPNPEFFADSTLTGRIESMQNAVVVQGAMCCARGAKTALLSVEEGINMDWGATIYNLEGAHYQRNSNSKRRTVEVPLVTFDELCKDYLEDEWYIKLDCEGCEYSCLIEILEKWGNKIKFIACEWHGKARFLDADEYEKRAIEMAKNLNIQMMRWD